MCVILYKPKKTDLPKYDILENCFYNNNDGAGYTFTSGKNVIIKKGFTNFNDFYKNLLKDYKKNNLKNKNLLIHFRIGTSGGLTKEKTQPFKITSNIKELNKLYIKNKKPSILHNGIFSGFTYNPVLSDTQNYIKDFLQPLLKSKIKNKNDIIYNSIKSSKLAILDYKDNVYLYGEYIKDNGIYYSNNSYSNWNYNPNIKKYDCEGSSKKQIKCNYDLYNYYNWRDFQ